MGDRIAGWKRDWKTQFIKAEHANIDVVPKLKRKFHDMVRKAARCRRTATAA